MAILNEIVLEAQKARNQKRQHVSTDDLAKGEGLAQLESQRTALGASLASFPSTGAYRALFDYVRITSCDTRVYVLPLEMK